MVIDWNKTYKENCPVSRIMLYCKQNYAGNYFRENRSIIEIPYFHCVFNLFGGHTNWIRRNNREPKKKEKYPRYTLKSNDNVL